MSVSSAPPFCPSCREPLGPEQAATFAEGHSSLCSSCGASVPGAGSSSSDDTAAFQRFYTAPVEPAVRPSLLARLRALLSGRRSGPPR